jgi:hypothetical protein
MPNSKQINVARKHKKNQERLKRNEKSKLRNSTLNKLTKETQKLGLYK